MTRGDLLDQPLPASFPARLAVRPVRRLGGTGRRSVNTTALRHELSDSSEVTSQPVNRETLMTKIEDVKIHTAGNGV
jgi:hypothetical protein